MDNAFPGLIAKPPSRESFQAIDENLEDENQKLEKESRELQALNKSFRTARIEQLCKQVRLDMGNRELKEENIRLEKEIEELRVKVSQKEFTW